MKKVIPLVTVTVLTVLAFALLGQAQGHLFLRIEHGDVALEIGGTEAGSNSNEPEVHIVLFSNHLGKSIDNTWWLVPNMEFESRVLGDFRNLRDSLSRYLAASNKGFACIYPSDEYDPGLGFQILGLGNAVLIRNSEWEGSGDCEREFFIEMKLSLNEAQKVVEALTTALDSVND